MPKPKEGETQKEFVSRCIPMVMDEGTAKDDKQAVAICYSMWREHMKGKSLSLSVTLKTDPTNGRIRWKAIANSGEFDQQGDRFDESFFDDLIANFWSVQDAVSRGEATQPGYAHAEGRPIPQLDVAHYSFQLSRADRVKARVGVPTFAYRDGKKMILQGHFEQTPLGLAAGKSVLADETDVIKTSVGVWPDWENVEVLADGKRVFKGGNGVAYLDHLALTAHPVDARTEIQAEGNQMAKSLQVSDDALEVLGDKSLVEQLETARAASKSQAPVGALVKADEPQTAQVAASVVTVTHETNTKDVTTVEKDEAADAIEVKEAQAATQVVGSTELAADPIGPMMDSLIKALNETQSVFAEAVKSLGTRLEVLEKSIPDLSKISDLATALNKSIEATQATEAQKVKAMLDNRGWLDMARLYSARSATDNTVDGGERAKGPQETAPAQGAGGPIAGRFIRT